MVQWVTALKISSLNCDYILRKNIMVIKIYNKSKLLKEISFSKGKICYILVNPPLPPAQWEITHRLCQNKSNRTLGLETGESGVQGQLAWDSISWKKGGKARRGVFWIYLKTQLTTSFTCHLKKMIQMKSSIFS